MGPDGKPHSKEAFEERQQSPGGDPAWHWDTSAPVLCRGSGGQGRLVQALASEADDWHGVVPGTMSAGAEGCPGAGSVWVQAMAAVVDGPPPRGRRHITPV